MNHSIKSPWKIYPFSETQFKRWRFGYWATMPNGDRRFYPALFEGPEWRKVGHRTIIYDAGALEIFFEYLDNSDRTQYRKALETYLTRKQKRKSLAA